MMAERGFRLGSWQAFAIISALAVVAMVVLVRTAPPPSPEARSGLRHPGGPRSEADSAAYLDSLEEAAERRVLRETMTLPEVAARAGIPVDSLAAELRLPATASLTIPLRAILTEYRLSLKDVHDARTRVQARLGSAANLKR
jgi:hypothetical protein